MPLKPLDPDELVSRWGATAKQVDLGGPTHYVEWDGPDDTPPVLLVHGLGGSHLNWVLLGPLLAKKHRVYAIDLAGFGLTFPGSRTAKVADNARLVTRFIDTVIGRAAYLVGNSMGGMITSIVAAARPDIVEGAVLVNPALPISASRKADPRIAGMFVALMTPRIGEAALRRMTRRGSPTHQVQRTMNMVFADQSRMDREVFEASVDLAAHRRGFKHGDPSFLQATRSLLMDNSRPRRSYKRMASISRPVLLIHGELDRLVPITAARRAAEAFGWQYLEMPDMGHVPMLEDPAATAEAIETFIAGSAQAAPRRPATGRSATKRTATKRTATKRTAKKRPAKKRSA